MLHQLLEDAQEREGGLLTGNLAGAAGKALAPQIHRARPVNCEPSGAHRERESATVQSTFASDSIRCSRAASGAASPACCPNPGLRTQMLGWL